MSKINNASLVLEGGGARALFTVGVLDVFLENNILFPACFGVSAGSSQAVSYVSRQKGRGLKISQKYGSDSRCYGMRNFITKGSMIDWNFLFVRMTEELVPLDFDAFRNSSSALYVGCTNCKTGETEFFHSNKMIRKDFFKLLSASSSLPLLTPSVSFNSSEYLDGGIEASIPYNEAFNNGYKKAVVILTQDETYRKKDSKILSLLKFVYPKFPLIVSALKLRADNYNASIENLLKLEKEGKVFIIRPETSVSLSRLEKDHDKLNALYAEGRSEALKCLPELIKWF